MSGEIDRILDSYINQEKGLLDQLLQIKSQRGDMRTEIIKDVAGELFGRKGGKYARRIINKQEKERIKVMEDNVDAQHRTIVNNITAFLRTISEWRKNIKEPNSYRLLPRIEKAQGGVQIATRVKATIKVLSGLKAKLLIYNKDIPARAPDLPGRRRQAHSKEGSIMSERVESVKIPSIFICYSSKDKRFVETLYNDLKEKEIDVWLDKWEIEVGDSITQKIEEGIENNDYLALILSKNSVESSWVKLEFSSALIKELDSKFIMILPILIENCKIPTLLVDKKYADFREDYQKGLDALLSAIDSHEQKKQFQIELKQKRARARRPVRPRLLRIQINRVWLEMQDMERIAGTVNEEDLFANLLSQYGMRRIETSELISVLMGDGLIYSPNPGYYKKTSSAKGSEKVVVSPQRVSIGDSVRVYSDSHTAGEVVQVYFDFVQSEYLLSEGVAGPDGVSVQFVTIPETEIGTHYFWVKDLATGITKRVMQVEIS